jgi:signal transduction histidine kinase
VNQLLVLSKIQENRYKFSNQKFNLNELVEDIAEDLSESTDGFDIKIEGKVDKEVTGDKEKISQVLINLITNAMKYSDKISKIDIGLKSNSREAVVSVRDYGIGIPQEFHSKIFERFYQVGGGSKNTYPGMGIGLFISSEIIKAHGGQIWLDSRVGKGTKFYFSLPYH